MTFTEVCVPFSKREFVKAAGYTTFLPGLKLLSANSEIASAHRYG